jgi:hypothetical protein
MIYPFLFACLLSMRHLAFVLLFRMPDFLKISGRDEERMIPLTQGAFSSSLDQRIGGSILSVKLIFHNALCLMRMDSTIAVLQYLFLEKKNASRLIDVYSQISIGEEMVKVLIAEHFKIVVITYAFKSNHLVEQLVYALDLAWMHIDNSSICYHTLSSLSVLFYFHLD